MSKKVHTFRRKEHIKKTSDFSAVFKRGHKERCGNATLFVLPNSLTTDRIGFAMPRGYGNAVERNRAKRLGREAYRLLKDEIMHRYSCDTQSTAHLGQCLTREHFDMVLLVKKPYPDMAQRVDTLSYRMEQMRTLLRKAGIA